MAPITFSLVALGSKDSSSFLKAAKNLPESGKALWLGKCQYWIHEPHLSTVELLGEGPQIRKWDYLLVSKTASTPSTLIDLVENSWSITALIPDEQLSSSPTTTPSTPPLPSGWSPSDSSALEVSTPPPDLEASLALSSRPFNSSSQTTLKSFTKAFGTSHSGPVAMFNLLAYLPNGGREQYFKYIAAFQESVGSNFGGIPIALGFGVTDRRDEGWEDTALIGYPSIWHFAAMLDSEAYADVDRRFKKGAIRDNPLLCCTEISLVG